MHLLPTLLFLLPTLTISLPNLDPRPQTRTQKTQHSPAFGLKSHVLTPPTPSFENLYLSAYHTSPTLDYATLSPKTAQNPGIVGFLNGTAQELADGQGDLLFRGGESGFVIRMSPTFSQQRSPERGIAIAGSVKQWLTGMQIASTQPTTPSRSTPGPGPTGYSLGRE
jgi:hypothetical protein